MNNFQDNRNRVAVLLNDSTNNQLYSTNLIALRHVNNPGNSALNNTKRSKEKKAGVFPIRYIAVLGFWRSHPYYPQEGVVMVSIRYIAILGFWQVTELQEELQQLHVSIRYIAVLGFWLVGKEVVAQSLLMFQSAISRYLCSDLAGRMLPSRLCSFNPLYRGTWVLILHGRKLVE